LRANVAPPKALVEADYDSKTRITGLEESGLSSVGQSCLVVLHAPSDTDLGRRYILENDVTTIGRGRDNDIVLPSDCVSRQHARIERRGDAVYIVDLASTNGTYINEERKPVRERRLVRGDQLRVGDTIFKHLTGADIELQYHDIIFRMAVTDGLTNLANRKQLDSILADEISRARRYGRSLSVLMLDIDHFKSINDTYGHLAGDCVLSGLASMLQKRLRPNDRLGRYGGEEFCAILPETPLANALRIAEDLRALVETHAFVTDDKEIRVTISVGIATLQQEADRSELYRRADEKLYAAKHAGRNRVCA
jgi:two-component system cell cycle response regulator